MRTLSRLNVNPIPVIVIEGIKKILRFFKSNTKKSTFDDIDFAEEYLEVTQEDIVHEHYERRVMLDLVKDLSDNRVLLLGSGPGIYASKLKSKCRDIVCLDKSAAMNDLAAKKDLGIQLLTHDVSNGLPFDDHSFDTIISPLTFQYVENWDNLFREIFRVLRPSGDLYFSVTNPYLSYNPKSCYFKEEQIIVPFGELNKYVLAYRRPLSNYFNPIIKSGLTLSLVYEAQPDTRLKKLSPTVYNKLKLHPLFLFFKCIKKDTIHIENQ